MNAKIKNIISYIIVGIISLAIGAGSAIFIIYKTPVGGISDIIAESKRNDELNRELEKRITEQGSTIKELGITIEQYQKYFNGLENSTSSSAKSIQQITDSIKRDQNILDRIDRIITENKNRLVKYNVEK